MDLHSFRFTKSQPSPEIVEYQRDKPTTELLDIAILSGQFSRFRIDPSLPIGSFERLYESWIAKTLESRPRDAIYTYQTDGRIAGLITVEWRSENCTIGLLAVLEKYQRRGIATKLIRHVRDVCMAKEVDSIEVKTQLSNTSARCLYLKNSFIEQDRSFLYHAHNIRRLGRQNSLCQRRI
jgi:dTDP-4-amino-4,6-dideoxy-D-galactose acyltransferase